MIGVIKGDTRSSGCSSQKGFHKVGALFVSLSSKEYNGLSILGHLCGAR